MDAMKNISEAINIYTSSIIDLGVALNVTLLEESQEIRRSLIDVSERIGEMSISSESHFQTLHVESQTSYSGINKLLQEAHGKLLHLHFALRPLEIPN